MRRARCSCSGELRGRPWNRSPNRAGVSKMTVYGHFRDKPALLSAVFERNIKAIRLPDLAVGPDPTSSLVQLAEFGQKLVWFLTRPEIVKTTSVMAACAEENPRL